MLAVFNKKGFPWEGVVWFVGLIAVSVPDPTIERTWSLCLFDMLGITFCPGCGLGHAVAFLMRGEWALSFASHPLAIPTVAILVGRVVYLFFRYFRPAFK
jgi:hypothetical protein